MMRGVVVLGMHRSGTSAATRLVNLLGVPLPAETDLLPNAFDNPRGHWESRSLVNFNDRLLAALGCNWTCPPTLRAGWEEDPAVRSLRHPAVATFRRVVSTPVWVWKDPRNCLLLPFWTTALRVVPVAVLVLRHPLEIAASLERRDLLDQTYGLALWERYLRTCISAIEGLRVAVTTYDRLLEEPVTWCEEVGSFLARTGFTRRPVPERDVLAFVEPRLRHFEAGSNGASPALTQPQRALAEALEDQIGFHDSYPLPALGAETPTTETLIATRRHAVQAAASTASPS